jgi:hypothetical protein
MNRFLIIFLVLTVSLNANGQIDIQQQKDNALCNRTVYGSSTYIKSLPRYICIPENFVIDDYVRVADLDKNGQNDFIAIKYNKKENHQHDGDLTNWALYTRSERDTVYSLVMTLQNIVPPFIKDISYDHLLSHPVAAKLFEDYPRRLSHELSFQASFDTIRLSYKFQDVYGKTFVFVHDNSNWYLENIEYFLGELPMDWWKKMIFIIT